MPLLWVSVMMIASKQSLILTVYVQKWKTEMDQFFIITLLLTSIMGDGQFYFHMVKICKLDESITARVLV